MKKTITLLSALIFSLALMIPTLIWADDGKHMEEGSGMKTDKSSHEEYNDKKHSKHEKGHKTEGSSGKEEYDKSADHEKMEKGSKEEQKMKSATPKREGS